MMTETHKLTEEILLAASDLGARLFRNNTGVARYQNGKHTTIVRYGVGPVGGGGSDLIGWTSDGIFLAIEIKVGKDRQTKQQKMWESWVLAGGGRAGVARSVEDAIAIINMVPNKRTGGD